MDKFAAYLPEPTEGTWTNLQPISRNQRRTHGENSHKILKASGSSTVALVLLMGNTSQLETH
jgi:hypothetical protein